MKSKTSITLSRPLLAKLDRVVGKTGNRSALIERAVADYLDQLAREQRDRRELQILNDAAEALNREAEDVLEYQVES
jgi:metal-responsive CopG/Arc/MetJ family transcriptional regulator